MTKQEIQAIKARHEAPEDSGHMGDCGCPECQKFYDEAVACDMRLSRHGRADILALITEIERVQSRSEQLQRQVPALKKHIGELEAENQRLLEYIDKIGKKAYDEHVKGNDRSGRLYGISEMCRPQNVNEKPLQP